VWVFRGFCAEKGKVIKGLGRMTILRGGWHSSSYHANRPVRAAALPRHSFTCPVLGIGY
jgi:hypothetical protein